MGGDRNVRKRQYSSDHEDYPSRDLKRYGTMLVVYRLLCKNARAGSILGKGGEVIAKLRLETEARIKMEDRMQGCDDRVVVVTCTEDELSDRPCPAQIAVMRLHDILEVEDEEEDKGGEVMFRMLVPPTQVGPLVGKQGAVIKGLRESTGATIRIHKEVPACAQLGDEMLQISGDPRAMRKAIERVLQIVRDSSHKPLHSPPPPTLRMLPPHLMTPPASAPPRSAPGTPAGPDQMESVFRLLVHNARVGVVIGKGGEHIKALRRETGAIVKVHDEEDDCDERVVSAMSIDDCHSGYSAAQEALLRVANVVLQFSPEQRGIRLLASQHQIGNLVGKGGARINAIRKDTETRIKVGGPDVDKPHVAEDDEEVVLVEGQVVAVLNALMQITSVLREGQARAQHKRLDFSPSGPSVRRGPLYAAMGAIPILPPGIGMGPPGPGPSFGGPMGGSSRHHSGGSGGDSQPSMRITIHRDQVGAVLGPRGSNIQQVRSVSGAKVKLHSAEGPGGSRDLEIAGTLEQMQCAHSMVHNYIQASSGQGDRGDRR